jgi:Fic family protein
MEASSLRVPGLDIEAGEFQVTLRNEPVFVGPTAEWQEIVNRLPLGVAQKRVLLSNPNGFTNEDYRRLNNVDRDQAYREIQEMVSAGILAPAEAAGRGAVYHLSPNVAEEREFVEGRLPTLRDHFRRQSILQNADFRALFSVSRIKAARELGRLVEEGYLRLEGKGRGAQYLPGELLQVRK